MRRFLFLLLIAATFCLAGMYHALPLMVLCAAEALVLLAEAAAPLYLRAKLDLSFSRERMAAREGEEARIRLTVRNTGKLPAGDFKLRLSLRYPQDGRAFRKTVAGSAPRGGSTLEVLLRAPCCGPVTVRLERLRVYGGLSLFSAAKRLDGALSLAVFPREQALRVERAGADPYAGAGAAAQAADRAAASGGDLRQLREYRPGDGARRIHWKLSARTDTLWTREYERETDTVVPVFLDAAGFGALDAAGAGAFYQLLSALALGLLPCAAAARVCWSDGGRRTEMDVSDTEGCQALLLRLWQSELSAGMPSERGLRLTAGLALYDGETLLRQFSLRDLEQEIEKFTLVI